jgi:hypothetical protein
MKTDPQRQNKTMHNLTGIFVRAIGSDGKLGVYDIAELDAESLTNWLMRDGGSNPLAENTVRAMLGHEQVIPANAEVGHMAQPSSAIIWSDLIESDLPL